MIIIIIAVFLDFGFWIFFFFLDKHSIDIMMDNLCDSFCNNAWMLERNELGVCLLDLYEHWFKPLCHSVQVFQVVLTESLSRRCRIRDTGLGPGFRLEKLAN